jgi:hypothetical protein
LSVGEAQNCWSLPTPGGWSLGACLGLILTEGVAGCAKIKRSVATLIRLNFHGVQPTEESDSKNYVKLLIYMTGGLSGLDPVADVSVNWRIANTMNLFWLIVRQEDQEFFD